VLLISTYIYMYHRRYSTYICRTPWSRLISSYNVSAGVINLGCIVFS